MGRAWRLRLGGEPIPRNLVGVARTLHNLHLGDRWLDNIHNLLSKDRNQREPDQEHDARDGSGVLEQGAQPSGHPTSGSQRRAVRESEVRYRRRGRLFLLTKTNSRIQVGI